MYDGRKSPNHQIREYCTTATTEDIYHIIKRDNPKVLMQGKRMITRSEFNKIITNHTEILKNIMLNGYPVFFPAGIGPVGIEIYEGPALVIGLLKKGISKRLPVPKARLLMANKKRLFSFASMLINTEQLSIEFTKVSQIEIINRYLKDQNTYYLTGPEMHKYARKIKYGTYK